MVPESDGTDQAVAICMKEWRDGHSAAVKYQRFEASFKGSVEFKAGALPVEAFPENGVRHFEQGEPVVTRKLVGYATTFNCLSEDRGGYCFTVVPGAFAASIARDDVVAMFNHSADMVLGRTSNGSLKLAEDAKGLKIEMDLPDTQFGRDMYTLVARGDVKQMSFGGIIIREMLHSDPDLDVISIHEFKLWDVSPVTFPAFEEGRTTIGVEAVAEKPCPARLLAAKRRLLDL
jgi:hypothetical protein